MSTSTSFKNKRRTILRLNFEKNYIEVTMDYELRDFFAQVEPNTAKPEDVQVLFAYFNLYWPFKTVYHNGKQINYPQLYRSYFVREERG